MATKQPCKNHPSFTFSGKECSPLGLGYSAEAEDPGTVMEGRDKTMWMVGIRNGVKIWNRVPSQIVASVTKPMAKEEAVIAPEPPIAEPAPVIAPPKKKAPAKKKPEPVPVEEPVPVPEPTPAPAPKKRAPPKKKLVIVEEAEPVPEEAAPAAPIEVEEPEKKAVKKAPKKKVATEAPTEEPEKKVKKAPNSFNIYMSFRTDQLKREQPELDHKQRFQQASNEWKLLDDDRKKAIIEEARAWKDNQVA